MEAKLEIESVRIVRDMDDDADTSYLGEYLSANRNHAGHRKKNPGAPWDLHVPCGEYVADHDEEGCGRHGDRNKCEYFRPYAGGEAPGTENYKKWGKQDFERMEKLDQGYWHYVWVRAEAIINIVLDNNLEEDNGVTHEINTPGMHGIEDDGSVDSDNYIASIEDDELSELHSLLIAFDLTNAQVDEAFKNVKDKTKVRAPKKEVAK